MINQQDKELRSEFRELLQQTIKGEVDRKAAIEEVSKLREELHKAKETEHEKKWEDLSRSMAARYIPDANQAIKKYYEQGFNLKTIVTSGYYGQDGIKKVGLKPKKGPENLYQSSMMLDLNAPAIS